MTPTCLFVKFLGIRRRFATSTLPLTICCLLFLSGFMANVPITDPKVSEWRLAAQETLKSHFQFIWCGLLLVLFLFFVTTNLQTFYAHLGAASYPNRKSLLTLICISLLLTCVLLWVAYLYCCDYIEASKGTDALVLITCMLLNQWLIWLLGPLPASALKAFRERCVTIFIVIVILSLCLAPLNKEPNVPFHSQFFYRGAIRWSGMWSNPNSFGLIMGVGGLLAFGRAWLTLRYCPRSVTLLYLCAFTICIVCVVKSYSRGAWVASVVGIIYLIWNYLGAYQSSARKVTATHLCYWFAGGLVIGVAVVLLLSLFTQQQYILSHRVIAAFGNKDFSSMNRLASYQDGINMIMDRPLCGNGWGDVIALHSALYLQSGISNGIAIKLNDFLMLVIRLGIPASCLLMICLVVWWFASSHDMSNGDAASFVDKCLCRVALITFSAGFMFSDGLFQLAFGGSMWLFGTLSFDFTLSDSPPELQKGAF